MSQWVDFSDAIKDIEKLIAPSITLSEVFKVVYRQTDENKALYVIVHMQQGKVIALDEELSLSAADLVLSINYHLQTVLFMQRLISLKR